MAENTENMLPAWFSHKTVSFAMSIILALAGWSNLTLIEQGRDIAVMKEQIIQLEQTIKDTNDRMDKERQMYDELEKSRRQQEDVRYNELVELLKRHNVSRKNQEGDGR